MGEKEISDLRLQEPISENRIEDLSKPFVKKEFLTTEEAAEYLGISAATLRNLCSDGKVPYYKWQRRNRYKTDELRILLLTTKRGGSYGY
jgi:excisionase family DNA binding protein